MQEHISQFRVYEESAKDAKTWSNYADENILLATHNDVNPVIDLTKPVMEYLSTSRPGLNAGKTPLWDMLKDSGRKREIEKERISWKLRTKSKTLVRFVEYPTPGNTTPGIRHEEFSFVLNEERFVPGDTIAPWNALDIEVVVKYLPQQIGTKRYLYTVQLADKRPSAYFPVELLQEGLKWKKTGASYGEASSHYGSTTFTGTSYVKFQSDLSDWGKSVEVTNKAHDTNLVAEACDSKGARLEQYPKQVISYIEAEFISQAKEEKESMLFRGRSAGKNLIDQSSGYHRRKGPGLLEFLADGNVIPYTEGTFSTKMISDFLQSVWFDNVQYANRNVVGLAGQGAITLWTEALKREYAMTPTMRNHSDFTTTGTSYDPKNTKGFKINTNIPTETSLFPAGSIKLMHFPPFDDVEYNGGNVHPETGLPLSSYDIVFLDWGLGNGVSNNIELITKKDSEVFTHICGTWSPRGPIKSIQGNSRYTATHAGRYYQLVAADTFGIRVEDVSLTAWFTLAVH